MQKGEKFAIPNWQMGGTFAHAQDSFLQKGFAT
jgi:hypothetical protein